MQELVAKFSVRGNEALSGEGIVNVASRIDVPVRSVTYTAGRGAEAVSGW